MKRCAARRYQSAEFNTHLLLLSLGLLVLHMAQAQNRPLIGVDGKDGRTQAAARKFFKMSSGHKEKKTGQACPAKCVACWVIVQADRNRRALTSAATLNLQLALRLLPADTTNQARMTGKLMRR